jgi:hypothetical protein
MKKAFFVTIILYLFLGKSTYACGPEWTYIGSDYGVPNCIYQLPDSEEVFLRGIPGMGLYRLVQDTTWELVSLSGLGVNDMYGFSWFPGQLFAQIGCGDLSRSFDNGFSWHQIRISDTGNQYSYTDFFVDPLDSTKWFLAAHTPTMDDDIFVSTNAGTDWQRHMLPGFCSRFIWFAETPEAVYTGRRSSVGRIQMSDFSMQPLLIINAEGIISIIKHPSQPWIYVLGAGPNGVLVRYDILTGDTMTRILPDTISILYDNYTYMKYSEGHGVLVGGKNELFLLDDNLQNIQIIEPPAPQAWSTQILFASSELWIVEAAGYGIFCRTPVDQAAHDHTQTLTSPSIACYPNPFNATTTISFSLPRAGEVKLNVYDVLGRVIDGHVRAMSLQAGKHDIVFDGVGMASGVYFVRVEMGENVQTRKMLLLR